MSTIGTPKPGKIISTDKATLLIETFRSAFEPYFDSSMEDTIPMACRLEGTSISEDLSEISIANDSKAYSFFENTNELFLTSPKAMADYLQRREPWEDYDICIFDTSLKWCIAISHEDRCIWVKRD